MSEKKYELIYCDPPWSFNNKNTGGSLKSGASAKYKVMNIKDLCEMPVENIAAPDCLLAMWWVGSQPAEALNLVRAWGFTLKTMTGFTWHKLTAKGKPHFGMGFLTRQDSENCLFAVRGKPKRVNASVRQFIESRSFVHSRKPAEARDRLVQLMGDVSRIELFATERVEGWDGFGNKLERSDVKL